MRARCSRRPRFWDSVTRDAMMQRTSALNFQLTSRNVALLVLVSLVLTTGCQAMRQKLPALPKPGDLAFWRKDSDAKLPPPPARQFDPAPTSGFGENKAILANNNTDRVRAEIDAKLDRANQAASGLADASPIRPPYGDGSVGSSTRPSTEGSGTKLASSGSGTKPASSGSGTKQASSGSGSKMIDLNSDAQGGLNQARNDFNSALSNVSKKSRDFIAVGNDVAAVKYGTDGRLIKPGPTGGSFGSQTKGSQTKGSQTKGGLEADLAKVRSSINNATSTAPDFKSPVADSLQGARDRFSNALAGINQKASQSVDSTKSFGGSLKDKLANATKDFGAKANPFSNQNRPATDFAANQKSSGSASKPAAGGFGFPEGAASISKPLAPAPTANNIAASVPPPSAAPPAQPTGNSFVASQPAAAPSSSFGQTRIANVKPFTPPATNQFNPGSAPAAAPQNTRVASNITAPSFNPVRDAAVAIPATAPEGRLATISHESDVDVPAKILSGAGSYSPGSTRSLR